jgi:hypothetical protein
VRRAGAAEVRVRRRAYEVEVTLDDGSQVDVHLDAGFNVLGDEADGPDDEGSSDDG